MATKDTKKSEPDTLTPLVREEKKAQKDFFEQIRRSTRGHKARFTIALKTAQRKLDFLTCLQAPLVPLNLMNQKPNSLMI